VTASIVSDTEIAEMLAARCTRGGDASVWQDWEGATGLFDPAPDCFRNAVDAVFWASLAQEEGRPALARLELCDVRDPQCRLEPCEVSAPNLRKLSPLMDESSNFLLVRSDSQIVGVGVRAGGVSIVAHRPGQLAVLEGDLVLGTLEQGKWTIVGGSALNFASALQRGFPGSDFKDRFVAANTVVQIAMSARRNGRGASFVLAPAKRLHGLSQPFSFPIASFEALSRAVAESREAQRQTPQSWQMERSKRLALIARSVVSAGAGIDGATVLDIDGLNLLGFGAKIDAPASHFAIDLVELPGANSRRVQLHELGGMRHQAAARLVNHNRDAIAITVSQDGPISLFAWFRNEEVVGIVKHLDRYLAADTSFT
jgi:hypothetical protein